MFNIAPMYVYKPLFMLELIIAEALFLNLLDRRDKFALRVFLSVLTCFCVAFLIPLPEFASTAWYSTAIFLAMFIVTTAMAKFCFKGRFSDVAFCTVTGYTVQHILQMLFELIDTLFGFKATIISMFYSTKPVEEAIWGDLAQTLAIVFLYIAIYAAGYFLTHKYIVKTIKKYGIMEIKTVPMLACASAILFVDIVFSSISTYSLNLSGNKAASLLLVFYNLACCVMALVLLFEWPHRKALESEIAVASRMRKMEESQYEASRGNIERFNLKFHDLKHQIRLIAERGEGGDEAVKEIEDIVKNYDSNFRTKNNALNVILTEKSFLCNKKGIQLSAVADGESLAFMKDSDVYSMLGNVIDNAIEAVEGLPEEKRTIGVTVKKIKGFVVVSAYNYFSGELSFVSGLPATTKKDGAYHGYGLKSVKATVEKYGGEMNISADNGVFEVNVAFPA